MKANQAKATRHLYLIRDGKSSYKIGSANDPKVRLNELQVGSCRRLALIWCIQTELANWIENYLHWKFRRQQIRGEWFSLNAEEAQWIMSLTLEEISRLRQEPDIPPQSQRGESVREDVTDAELAILQVLWQCAAATIRQLTDVLYPDGNEAHYATVQKLLERLEAKGHVHRDRSGHAHRFAARTNRDALVGHRLRTMAEKLCGGLMTPLLTHLVRAEALSSQERQELRDLIDKLDRKTKSR